MSNKGSNAGLFLIIGLLVGGILALLFAPKRGEDLRHEIGERLGESVHTFERDVEQMRKRFEAEAEELRKRFEEETKELRQKIEEQAKKIES